MIPRKSENVNNAIFTSHCSVIIRAYFERATNKNYLQLSIKSRREFASNSTNEVNKRKVVFPVKLWFSDLHGITA